MRKKRHKKRGPPPKTIWTVVWIAVLGSAVVLLHDADKEGGKERTEGAPAEVEAWGGPVAEISPHVDETEPEPEPETDKSDETAIEKRPPGTAPREPHQPIEDPGHSMCGFFRALRAVDGRTGSPGPAPVRILHYGDSILTTDQLSHQVRTSLQHRFGDAGHGFVLLGRPWRWYHHLGVRHGSWGKWETKPLTEDPFRDGFFGLGGVAFETLSAHATAWAGTAKEGETGRRVATYDISYLAQPRGGSFDVLVDDMLMATVSTRDGKRHGAHHLLHVSPGESMLTVKTRGDGPVRLFGAVLESGRPGIVYDSLAINGVRVGLFDRFNQPHWIDEMRYRKANLVIMMCGANEGANDALALGAYRVQLEGVLRTIRNALPDAGCLVMSPLDQAVREEDGTLGSRKMPRKLTRTQHEVALAEGCAFFDTYQAMGGENSMAKWYKRGLAGADFIHPTETGARKIGSWLAEAILAGYEKYLFNGETCASSVTSL